MTNPTWTPRHVAFTLGALRYLQQEPNSDIINWISQWLDEQLAEGFNAHGFIDECCEELPTTALTPPYQVHVNIYDTLQDSAESEFASGVIIANVADEETARSKAEAFLNQTKEAKLIYDYSITSIEQQSADGCSLWILREF